MIIDAHCHLGSDCSFDQETDEERLARNFAEYGIDGGIIQPYIPRPYVSEYQKIHDRIHAFTLRAPNRYFGMASMNPHFLPEDYDRETIRCVRELGFVGIKITPAGHACTANSRDGMHVFELAQTLNVPVMVHSGFGIPFSDPLNVQPAAEEFPDVRIVIAHCGANFCTAGAILMAKQHDNVFLEPSGAGLEACIAMLDAVGPGKVMFSTDVVPQTATELAKFRDIHRRGLLTEDGLEQVLYRTAHQVFPVDAVRGEKAPERKDEHEGIGRFAEFLQVLRGCEAVSAGTWVRGGRKRDGRTSEF